MQYIHVQNKQEYDQLMDIFEKKGWNWSKGYEKRNDTIDTILKERLNLFVKLLINKCMNTTDNQDTKPYTVYRSWDGYGYQAGHIDMECKHSHVNWTEKDLETIRTAEKVRQSVSSLLSIYLL